jgi:hypothetical protein
MRFFVRSAQAAALLSLVTIGCSMQSDRDASRGSSATVLPVEQGTIGTKSLTGSGYTGTKFYFGWGMNDNGNPEMDNEVEYDVRHTHDIFTKAIGGSYVGTSLIGQDQVTSDAITGTWAQLTKKMTANDMYLQYSSGHGYPGGLEVGVDYDAIINAALAMPAKEIVIFTMACFSGGLVDAFNQAKDRWADFKSQGRTLFVMASSTADEESSTGPGTDPDEPNGPDGSAGPFGHALWKALIGYADQTANGGNGDGFISLDEITKYVVSDSESEGGQTPVYTGVYDPTLKIAEKPTLAQARAMFGKGKVAQARLAKAVADGVLHD